MHRMANLHHQLRYIDMNSVHTKIKINTYTNIQSLKLNQNSKIIFQAISLPTIEDWQLPNRYRRKPLDTFEIEYINRGGPA